ncbi:helix-turn-helix transcriptional regulator [Paenibacillus barengoltzii]|jgi:AraC-like DNA-binding protein|uniref:AraC-type DNA-binding protein n=1 Tax=Paenibacillus barengoltzii J12 TaxID=935846 RepID=A0ABY1LU65_9BACL|nr:AraC family transcriptional regulator [Paenibacillus barengoltzii]SMF01050.1 AraC-type DNA-binding protein [Paenibacillus barengoltzii J12]
MYEHRYREDKLHGVPEFPMHIYRVEHPAGAHSILPVHWHNEMEIIYLAQGSATFRIENHELALCQGEALIVHPGELHSGVNDHEAVCYYSIVFKLSWLSSYQNDRIQQLFLGPILQGTEKLPLLLSSSRGTPSELLEYIRQLILRFEHPLPAYELAVKGILLLLIADLRRYGLIEKNDALGYPHRRKDNEQIKKVLTYIEEHSHEKLDLDQLAAAVSLSRSHFCTFFKTQTGMRPMEYVNFIRINKAAELLRTGRYNVLEAALESGYQHVSYFSKWFKLYMNMTPSEYKASYASGL